MILDKIKANIGSAFGHLLGGKIRKFVYKKYGAPNPHKSKEEVIQEQIEKFNELITNHYTKTPYGREVLEGLGELIISEEDIKKFPIITREIMEKRGLEMIIDDVNPDKTKQTHTSGTTTGNQVVIYRSKIDLMQSMLGLNESYEAIGLNAKSRIRMLLPRGSSAWEANGMLQLVLPRFRFVDSTEDKINEEVVKKLLKSECIHSYANIPVQVFNTYQDVVKEMREKGEIKIKGIILTGDEASQENMDRLHELLGDHIKITNPLMSIEMAAFTKTCPEGHNHIIGDLYHAWTDPKTNEIIATPLLPAAMIYPNYETGDAGRLHYECKHGWGWPALEFHDRVSDDELHKSFRLSMVKGVVQGSNAFLKDNKIRVDTGGVETHLQKSTPFRREFNSYVIKGPNYDENTKESIIEELNNRLLDIYVPRLYGEGIEIKNWDYNWHLISLEQAQNLGLTIGKWKRIKRD